MIRDLFTLASLPDMTQVRQFWACVSNFVTGGEQQSNYLSSSTIGALKMGHSTSTHATTYSSERVGADKTHFNAYHFAIGDTSYRLLKFQNMLSLADLRAAMRPRYPSSVSPDGHNYLSLEQKELVEFGYGSASSTIQHCLGLLAPGDGKSECYIIPTIARHLANQKCKTIIHISPYGFIAGYQFANANAAVEKLGLETHISIIFFTGSDIREGSLPEELSNKESLPSLIFLNLDGAYNLFTYFFEDLKSWVDVVDKMVIDEVHTIFSELSFRDKYKLYFRLPVIGIPMVALSGSLPLFVLPKLAKRLCLSSSVDLGDIKIIHGSHVVGTFPKGFKIKVNVSATYVNKVANFVVKRLGSQPDIAGAVHVFVAEKGDGGHLFNILSCRYNCRFVSSDTKREVVNQVASEWSKGEINVLISTSIALVGNENPRCRYLACAGYLYDSMQIVQACGRLRKYMRISTGQVLFAVPEQLSDFRILEDRQQFTRLMNERFLSSGDYSHFKATMTSGGVHDWLVDASLGQNGCAMMILSTSFGKSADNCGACPHCRMLSTKSVQQEAVIHMEQERKNGHATERALRRLTLVCAVCKRADCCGLPILKGKGSMFLPENRVCCFSWKNCYQCGVSNHDRKTQCFNKSYMNNIACCECWVYKNVPGAKRHDVTDCEVFGRLRRLLSHHFIKTVETKTFQQYIEGIYSSKESFCHFMSTMEATCMSNKTS